MPKNLIVFLYRIILIVTGLDQRKNCKICRVSNCLALNTIGPFLPDTQGKWADVRAGEVTFNTLCVPSRHIRAKERWLLSPLWDKK